MEKKIAIVTGAGRGIGKEIAFDLSMKGSIVVVCSRTKEDLCELVDLIKSNGGEADYYVADLTRSKSVDELTDFVMKKYGRIDILINNAGGYPREMYEGSNFQPLKLWDWTEEKWDKIIEVNLKTTFLCTSKVLPIMVNQESGDIINISSRMGRIASEMGAYAVAKSGVITLTKTAALQAKPYGVRVNAISPGVIDTPGQRMYNNSQKNDNVIMGNVNSVSKAILYILYDAPHVMNGQSLDLFMTV